MSNPASGTDSPTTRPSHSRLRSGDLDHVNDALVAHQVKDAAATHHVSITHGTRSTPFGAGGLL